MSGRVIAVDWDRAREVDVPETTTPVSTGPGGIESVFRTHVDGVYRFLYRQVGNHHDAEDLTSEVFLKAARHLDSGRSDKAIAAWLFTIGRTVVADHWRQHYRLPPLVDIDAMQIEAVASTSSYGDKRDQHERLVAEVLDELPERYAFVLRLRFLQGCTLTETAEEMGVTLANAKVLQHRALAAAVRVAGGMS